MKKLILTLSIFLIMLSGVIAYTISSQEIYKKIQKSSVKIYTVNPDFGFCTGTIIKDDGNEAQTLTCKHCVSLNEETYVENNRVIDIRVSASDDLAIMTTASIPNKEPMVLAKYKALQGYKVYVFGQPGFTKIHSVEGTILRYSEDWGYMNIKVIPGCSGGGVFDEEGKLVGVVWGGLLGDSIGIFEPLDDVKSFINRIK